MSKYRQEKTLKEHERITENLNSANNVALLLYDIYSKDALENYLGFWRPNTWEGSEWEDEEEEEEEEEDGSDKGDGDGDDADDKSDYGS